MKRGPIGMSCTIYFKSVAEPNLTGRKTIELMVHRALVTLTPSLDHRLNSQNLTCEQLKLLRIRLVCSNFLYVFHSATKHNKFDLHL